MNFNALLIAWVLLGLGSAPQSFAFTVNPVAPFNKIVWVWLENSTYTSLSVQKYVKTLSSTYPNAKFTQYYPNSPVTQGDAFTLIAGTDLGVKDNSLTKILTPTLIDLLESKNIPWKIYAEDYPGACYLGEGTATYQRYRVPFLSIGAVQSDRYECMKVVGLANFADDLKYNLVPRFSVLIPNLPDSGVGTTAASVDAVLKTNLDAIVKAPDLLQNTTVIMSTINSPKNPQDKNGMFVMILGAGVQTGATTVTTAYSHVNLLKTLETGLGLGSLTQTDAEAVPMVGFWK